jgi:hypothetical protein
MAGPPGPFLGCEIAPTVSGEIIVLCGHLFDGLAPLTLRLAQPLA